MRSMIDVRSSNTDEVRGAGRSVALAGSPCTLLLVTFLELKYLTKNKFKGLVGMIKLMNALGDGIALSTMLTNHATTPSLRRLSISSMFNPSVSFNTSSVCWPRVGGGVLIPGVEYEYLTGVFTNFMGPHTGWSTS